MMRSRRRVAQPRPPPPPPPLRRHRYRIVSDLRRPPELNDDAIAEILLRLPPNDPACLVSASLVSKQWHRILSEPTFPDRYREFHGTPPLLGFLSASYTSGCDESAGRFVPMTTTTRTPFHSQPVFRCRTLADCRHGRVLGLLDVVDGTTGTTTKSLAVWDPATGDHTVLSNPDPPSDPNGRGAVICATAGCDHRTACYGGGPFQVVFVRVTSYIYGTDAVVARVYSSQTAAWSAPASVQIKCSGYHPDPLVERKRAAIVGDQVYFLLRPGAGILKYDLGTRCLTVIGLPCTYTYTQTSILMNMEGGSLGFVVGDKDDYSTLLLWRATEVNPANGSMGWVQDRIISLNNLVPTMWSNQVVNVVGFAEGVDILFLSVGQAGRGIMFELKSGRIRKLSNPVYCYYGDYFPYLSFYIPDFASHNRRAQPAETK